MSIYDKAEVRTQGPTSQRKAPSVDRFRRALYPNSVVGDEVELPDDLGEPLPKPHTVTEAEVADLRRAKAEARDERASTVRRDPTTGQAVRTYEDGRTEIVPG